MEHINCLLRDLDIIISKCEYNESHIRIEFNNYKMFIKYLKHVSNCKLSSDLSRSIHTMWKIEIFSDGILINLFDIINNFSSGEFDKITENNCQQSSIIFPFSAIDLIKNQLVSEIEFQIIEQDSQFENMECDNEYDISDDLIYSDDDI